MTMAELQRLFNSYDARNSTLAFHRKELSDAYREFDLVFNCGWNRSIGVVQAPGGKAQKVAIYYGRGSYVFVEHVLDNEELARSSKHWRGGVVSDFVVTPNCSWKPAGVKVESSILWHWF